MRSVKSRGVLTRGCGMNETVRHMWVLTLNYSASMHDAMVNLTGIVTKSSEQHTNLRASRRKQVKEHGLKFTACLQERNPFGFEDENRHSLSTGIISMTSKDSVNCEDAEELGLRNSKRIRERVIECCYNQAQKSNKATGKSAKYSQSCQSTSLC